MHLKHKIRNIVDIILHNSINEMNLKSHAIYMKRCLEYNEMHDNEMVRHDFSVTIDFAVQIVRRIV